MGDVDQPSEMGCFSYHLRAAKDITDIVELYFCAESDELGQMKAQFVAIHGNNDG